MKNHNSDTDWKTAGKRCLTTALNKATELAETATEFKSLESLIKTVGDVVGFGLTQGRRGGAGESKGDDDDD